MRWHFPQARAKRSRRSGQAFVRKQDLEVETLSFVPDRRITTTRLTVEQEAEAEAAFAPLTRIGHASLLAVAHFYGRNYRDPLKRISTQKAVDRLIAEKRSANLLSLPLGCHPLHLDEAPATVTAFRALQDSSPHQLCDLHQRSPCWHGCPSFGRCRRPTIPWSSRFGRAQSRMKPAPSARNDCACHPSSTAGTSRSPNRPRWLPTSLSPPSRFIGQPRRRTA